MNEELEHIVLTPSRQQYETPLFFQHGMFCTAQYWQSFMRYFADLGYETHALNLPGRGKSTLNKGHINRYGIDDYLHCFKQAVEEISPPPVIIAHSLGGYLVLKYLEANELPGVVLIASFPHTGATGLMLRVFCRHPIKMLRALIALNLALPSADIAGELFFSDPPPVDLETYYREQCVPDSMKMGTNMMFRVRLYPEKVTTPALVMAGDRDATYSIKEQQGLAKVLGAEFMVLPNQAHNAMLETGWQQTADNIHNWILKTTSIKNTVK